MLLTITTTASPATDLGYLLHKHPERVQELELSFGKAYVFYPEATEARCTAALLLDVDPVGLSRSAGPGDHGPLEPYVNDRPYVASSFLSVALSRVFGSALGGHCEQRPELVERALPLAAALHVLPCRGGEPLLRRMFEPLGYAVEAKRHLLRWPGATASPSAGEGPYFSVELKAERPLRELLMHLYVLVPVLDDDKHYYVGEDEVDKLLRQGEGWLATHPERELIANRYLKHQGSLTRRALAQLVDDEDDPDETAALRAAEEEKVERPLNLTAARIGAVLSVLRAAGARSVADLGCGEGRFLRVLLGERSFDRIAGMDVSMRALERAADRLHLRPEGAGAARRERLTLLHGSLGYRDARLHGFDAAVAIEVIEHLDPARLTAFERVLFEHARPRLVVITTPNIEHNVRFSTLAAGKLRHRDHRFEWTRAEFQAWATGTAERHAYEVSFAGVGADDPEVGAPTQMGVFHRHD